jgi:hypothetical protein
MVPGTATPGPMAARTGINHPFRCWKDGTTASTLNVTTGKWTRNGQDTLALAVDSGKTYKAFAAACTAASCKGIRGDDTSAIT